MAKRTIDEVIQQLKEQLIALGSNPDIPTRQHGKLGTAKENEDEEKIRIRNNLASQVSRLKKKLMMQELDSKVKPIEDEDGITDKDERRFKQCFIYENIHPELVYVQRMTGLTVDQIRLLEAKYNLKTITY